MAKLVLNDDEVVDLEDGSPLKDPCEEGGVPFACTEGICGTCVIEVKDGGENLSEMTQEELDFLGDSDDERLACQCTIKQGTVKIDY